MNDDYKKIASMAGRILRDPNRTKQEKSIAASALSQISNINREISSDSMDAKHEEA